MTESKRRTKTGTLPPVHDSLLTVSSIAPATRSNVADLVARRLRADILSGRIAPGSRLPAERELASALGVNRLTLRASLAQLEALGLIATRHGSGSIVNDWHHHASLEAMTTVVAALNPSEHAYGHFVSSILEFRRAIASEIYALAIGRVDSAAIARLDAIRERMKSKLDDPLAFAEEDIRFMRELCVAVDNVCFELVLNTFAKLIADAPEFVKAIYADCKSWLDAYPASIEMLKTGKPEVAWTVLRQTLEARDRVFLSNVRGARPVRSPGSQ